MLFASCFKFNLLKVSKNNLLRSNKQIKLGLDLYRLPRLLAAATPKGDMYVQNVFFAFFQLRFLTLLLCSSLILHYI